MLREVGVRFGTVLAGAGYGSSAAFRHALDERGLRWAVGILFTQKVYAAEVALVPPPGRARTLIPDRDPRAVEAVLDERPWRRVPSSGHGRHAHPTLTPAADRSRRGGR